MAACVPKPLKGMGVCVVGCREGCPKAGAAAAPKLDPSHVPPGFPNGNPPEDSAGGPNTVKETNKFVQIMFSGKNTKL